MREAVQFLVGALLKARHFEDAAEVLLQGLLKAAGGALAASQYAGSGRLLRGIVYLRPGEAYRGLAVVDVAGGKDTAGLIHASATAWNSLIEHRCAVSIDIAAGTIQPHRSDAASRQLPRPADSQGFTSRESQQRFLGREATHVFVLPLRVQGGNIDGMVSLEAACRAAMGLPFIWQECSEQLQLMADIAAPYLTGLPLRPATSTQVDEFLPVVGSTMGQMLPMLRVFAQEEETLLIAGPTGAGKSRLARWSHHNSSRRQGPFEVLDLMTVPEELQMAELFGWRKGAFTGAVRDTVGYIERAGAGTLFIDEIDKLSLKAQAGLLHVLEERTYRVLGDDSKDRRANVRFIIGTNTDLHKAVKAGRFREDLYYRINVLPVTVPPLNERQDEIPLWANYMVNRRHRERLPEGQARLSAEAEHQLSASNWPGNLRQLDNIIRRAYTLAMVEHGSSREVILEERHVSQALMFEQGSEPTRLLEALHAAAQAFFHEARRRQDVPLELDLADAFRGFVLGVGFQRVGREEALRLFGLEAALKNRNLHRLLKREHDRVEALCKALGGKPDPILDELRSGEEGG